MAKKNLNPADAFRKAQRKKELKKNKAERSKTRDFTLVKKDTWDLEDEIAKLEAAKDPTEQSRLADLKAELEKINRKKAEYVEEHPEHRRLVYRPRRKEGDDPVPEIILPKRRVFGKNGLPRHPERSIHYDPVMNPFGVAPPGMSYAERPPLPGEIWSDEDSEGGEDDIAMPPGPPPGVDGEDYDVDDITMPEGPPPSTFVNEDNPTAPPLPPLTELPTLSIPPPPPGFPPSLGDGTPPLPPGPMGINLYPPPPPPPRSGFPPHFVPHLAPSGIPMYPIPTPPPGFFPRENRSAVQNPLYSVPHQTFQAYHDIRSVAPAHPSLPSKPSQPPAAINSSHVTSSKNPGANLASATVFAAPQLRDFKKEATSFVPTSIKRRKPSAAPSKVNAAPGMEGDDDQEPSGPARPDLLAALKDQFGPARPISNERTKKVEKKDDYDRFMEDIGDILGSAQK